MRYTLWCISAAMAAQLLCAQDVTTEMRTEIPAVVSEVRVDHHSKRPNQQSIVLTVALTNPLDSALQIPMCRVEHYVSLCDMYMEEKVGREWQRVKWMPGNLPAGLPESGKDLISIASKQSWTRVLTIGLDGFQLNADSSLRLVLMARANIRANGVFSASDPIRVVTNEFQLPEGVSVSTAEKRK